MNSEPLIAGIENIGQPSSGYVDMLVDMGFNRADAI